MIESIERRRRQRIKVHFTSLAYYDKEKNATGQGYIVNINEGGLCLRASCSASVGEHVFMRFVLPHDPYKFHGVKGEIKWNSADGRYGIKLIELTPKEQHVINKYVERSIKRDEEVYANIEKRFIFKEADTPKEIESACKVRHYVYCLEHKFEKVDSSKLEKDEHDEKATHFIIKDTVRQKDVIGTVRMVRGIRSNNRNSIGLPFEKGFSLDELKSKNIYKNPQDVAEISRLAIIKEYRRRARDFPDERISDKKILVERRKTVGVGRRGGPILLLGLWREIYRYSKKNGISSWCAVMEKKLNRLLEAFNIPFNQASEFKDYHGLRALYHAEIADVEKLMTLEDLILSRWFLR